MSRFATSSPRFPRTRQAQLILLPPRTTAESPVGYALAGVPKLPHTLGLSAVTCHSGGRGCVWGWGGHRRGPGF